MQPTYSDEAEAYRALIKAVGEGAAKVIGEKVVAMYKTTGNTNEMQRAIDHMEQRAFAVDEKDLLVNAAAGHLERGERHGVRRSSIGGCHGRLARGSTEDGHARIRVDRGRAGG